MTGAEPLLDPPGVGEPVRKGLLEPNFAARASGEGRMAQRGWRMEMIWDTSESEFSSNCGGVDAVRRCDTDEVTWDYKKR